MRILITGVTGFIGSHLASYLVDNNYVVFGLIRKPIEDEYLLSRLNNVSLFTFDEDSLVDLISKIKPDIVIHLASLYLTTHSYEQIDDLIKSNITFPTKLLEAMSINNVTKLINTGTSWQHYNSSSYDPVNLYAATKQACDDIIKFYTSGKGFSCVTLKLFDTYGPDDTRNKLISLLDKCSQIKQSLSMSPGDQIVSLTHVYDVCAAYLTAINVVNNTNRGESFFYGVRSNEECSLKELVKKYEIANGVTLDIRWGEKPYRDREVMTLCQNLLNIPHWTPVIKLSEGLKIENRM